MLSGLNMHQQIFLIIACEFFRMAGGHKWLQIKNHKMAKYFLRNIMFVKHGSLDVFQ